MNIIITGASKGIGFAIAESFASQGNTLLLCSRNAKELYDAVAELQTKYPESTIKGKPTDLTNESELSEFANWCLEQGPPHILVNNAGLFLPGKIYQEPAGLLETLINTNLYTAYHLSRKIVPAMMQAHQGQIYNICSVASLKAYENGGAYSVSKFALMGFSKNLREEMKPYGIKVIAVYPGATMSSSWEGANIDPKRIMEATDIAKMILASSQLSNQAVVEDIILRPQLGDL